MPWVRFTQNHDFTPAADRRKTFAYKVGTVDNVTRECADQAVGLGRAVRVRRPATRVEAGAVREGLAEVETLGGEDGLDAA